MAPLTDEKLLHDSEGVLPLELDPGEPGEPDYVPEGFYWDCPDDSPVPEADGWPLFNPEDTVKTTLDTDVYSGCCGPTGRQGPNTDCRNGHRVGIEIGDCWTVHCLALDPDAVVAIESDGSR